MAHGEIPQESTAIGQPSSALSSERLRELVRRYAYGAILTAALLVLWWGVEGPLPLASQRVVGGARLHPHPQG